MKNEKAQNLKNKLTAKIASQSTETLKEIAAALMSRFDDSAGVALNYVLDELERRMPSADFVAWTETI